jgi:cysteine-rich repeat protein
MLVTFSSDGSLNGAGFSAGWAAASIGLCGDMFRDLGEDCDDGGVADGDGCSSSCTVESGFSCSGAGTSYGPDQCSPLLTAASGSFSDGSDALKYLPNTDALWILAPAGLSQIRVEIPSLDTQLGHDFVSVFSCADADCSTGMQLVGGRLSGTGARAIKVPSGFARLRFTSDASVHAQGFSASWGAAGSSACGDSLRAAGEECDDGNTAGGYLAPPTAPPHRARPPCFSNSLSRVLLVAGSFSQECALGPEYAENHLHPQTEWSGRTGQL